MGKILIIKGANFSAVAVDTVEPSVEYDDLTSKLVQGFVTTGGKLYTNTGNNYTRYVTAIENENSYLTNSQNVEWFIPVGYNIRPWALGGTPAIQTAQDCDGIIGDGTQAQGDYIVGEGQWITATDIYSAVQANNQGLNVSPSDYPVCGVNYVKAGSTPTNITPSELITDGAKVRRRSS